MPASSFFWRCLKCSATSVLIHAWFTWFLYMAPTSRYTHCGFDTEVLCCEEREKKRDQKTKTKVYFCRTTTLHSVADVRSWIYKTKAVSALPTCCSFLLTEGWEINGSSSKENTFPVCWSKTFGNMSTVSKWQLQVCHFICSLLRISHVLIVALVPLLLFPFFFNA